MVTAALSFEWGDVDPGLKNSLLLTKSIFLQRLQGALAWTTGSCKVSQLRVDNILNSDMLWMKVLSRGRRQL